MKWDVVAWGFSGAVVGALGVQQLRPVPVLPAPNPVAAAACAMTPERTQRDIAQLEHSVYSEQLSLRMVEQRAVDAAGEPTPWPDSPPAMLLPSALQASVEMGLDEAGLGDLVLLMCDEYPCVVGVTLGPPGPKTSVSPADYDGLFRAIEPMGYGAFKRSFLRVSQVEVAGGFQAFAVFALHRADLDGAELGRSLIRAEQGMASVRAELGGPQ